MTNAELNKLPLWAQQQIREQLNNKPYQRSSSALNAQKEPKQANCGQSVNNFRVEMPLYMTIHKKTKKDKTILLGMNIYRNAHYTLQHKMKKFVAEKVKEIPFRDLNFTRYCVNYVLWYKNITSDAMNCIAFLDKALQDALQEMGCVEEDNVSHYVGGQWRIGGRDRENPRLEAIIIKSEVER